MNKTPGIARIIQNDSWAAPSVGGFLFALIATIVIYLTKGLTGVTPDNAAPLNFVWLTCAAFVYSVTVTVWRVRHVAATFENGVEVTARVLESSVFRSVWTLKLHYIHFGQHYDVKLKQVITEKTRHMLQQKELILIMDQRNPKNILLRDAYL